MKKFYHTLIIGTGCAGYNAALRLHRLGVRDIAIITEGRYMGTSRNTGSDKQTYYKLSLAGGDGDSVREMAQTLYDGGAVMGEHAMAEAAYSVRAFMNLVELGVPFPCNEYGEYAGYKTDHDPRCRATSCGPLTSKYMTEALERAVMDAGVEIIDLQRVIKILTKNGAVTGVATA
ncbi:MAG: FAD-binding protein, partial [Clostridia bacterium]|nr:FAD-binding protein [Clostridia bacterium]